MSLMTAKNRKKAEKLIYDTLMKLEPAGKNAAKYKKIFDKMSDKEFIAYFQKVKDDENNHLYIENDLYGDNNITLSYIEDAAKFLNVPLEEHVYIKHKTEDGSVIRTPYKVPVMYIHLKRMQQLLSKKVKSNVDIDSGGNVRSRITGSLNSDNKSGRFTDMDVQALISVTSDTGIGTSSDGQNQSPIVFELLGARGDNNKARMGLSQSISLFGSASLSNMYGFATKGNKNAYQVGQASTTLDVFLLAAGMKSDIQDPSYLVKQGSNE